MNKEQKCKYFLILVIKLKEIFLNINEIKNERVDLIATVISTEVLIKKVIKTDEAMAGMSVTLCDDTGIMNGILFNDKIKFAKIGKTVIIRSARVEILNGFLYLILDVHSNIFEYNDQLLANKKMNLENNYSNIKLTLINTDLI